MLNQDVQKLKTHVTRKLIEGFFFSSCFLKGMYDEAVRLHVP